MGNKVFFCPRISDSGTDDFTGSHLKVSDQRLRPMPGILELVQFQLALGHRLVRMYALQCLDAGFFINADHMYTGFVQFLCLVIKFAYDSDVLPKIHYRTLFALSKIPIEYHSVIPS